MFCLATSPIAPVLGQRVPVRGPARLLHRSYARAASRPRPGRRAELVLTTTAGDVFQADLDSFLEWQLWAFGAFEACVAQLFSYLVGDGDQCVDVGANVGVHAVRLGKLTGPRGAVIAIEPDAELSRRAAANVALNGLANVRVLQAAASDRPGERVSLFRAATRDPNRARSSLLRHEYLTGQSAQVDTVTIDQACQGPVALIKIDVEGHEAAVVAGAAATIARHAPAIIFEYAPELLSDPSQCPFGQLAGQGYEMFRICCKRSRLTGRGVLELHRLPALPAIGGDLLAVSANGARRVGSLIRAA